MSCEHLVCASCAGPVADGRCPTCRARRADVHHHGVTLSAPAMVVLTIALVLVAIFVLGAR